MPLSVPTSVDSACLPPSVNEVLYDSLPLEVSPAELLQGHPLSPWQGEASPVSTSPACGTPRDLEQSHEDLNALVADLTLLQDFAIAHGSEGTDVLHVSLKQDSDDKQHEQFAPVEIPNGFFGFQSDEEDDDDDEEDEFRPKGSPNPPTKPRPSAVRSIASVDKPVRK